MVRKGFEMTNKALGKSHRSGLTLLEVAKMFADEDHAKKWIAKQRWPNGPKCPRCQSTNVQSWIKHPNQTHRCRDCKNNKMFSVKIGTVMEGSKLKYRHWAVGIYLFTTNIKGISSMRLHRELGITQKAAWFMLQRLRKAYELEANLFSGPVEIDETYVGGKRKKMSNAKRKTLTGRGAVGKTAVVGAKDRETNNVSAEVVQSTDKDTLQGFVEGNTGEEAEVFTDYVAAYRGLDRAHDTVNHSAGEYVRGRVHTNGVESFWAMFKRGHKETYHKMSPKHLQRYVDEFAGRHNVRDSDTIDQMAGIVTGMEGKRMTYDQLIEDNGLSSAARGGG